MENQSNSYGVAALVCGILSLVFVWVGYFIPMVLGILAIVFAAKSKNTVGSNGLATGGLVTGILGIVSGLPVTLCSLICGGAICAAL